jgi:dienelactone hydrolase
MTNRPVKFLFLRLSLSLILAAACAQHCAWAERHFDEAKLTIDGQQRRYYHLHDEVSDAALPIIVLIDGSGCSDFAARLPGFFEKYPTGLDLYFLEKPGIVKGASGAGDVSKACTPEYERADYAQKRVSDTLAFLDQEPQLRAHGSHSLALVGFSEGGKIAPLVAHASERAGWLVTVGAGAMRQGDGFLVFADRGVAPYAKPYSRALLLQEFAAIAKDPDNLEREFFGHSYKYWSSHLFDDPLPVWASLDIHMVTAMGSKDENEPIEAGRRLRDYFAAHPEKDFQFIEYAGGAHNLKVGDKNNLQDFVANLAKWFRGESHPFAHD